MTHSLNQKRPPMKTTNPVRKLLLSAIAACAAFSMVQSDAIAQIVIQDTFTAADGTANNGRQPTTDELNRTWVSGNQGSGTQLPIIENNRLRTGFNSWHYIDISNSATLEKPTTITLSADLTVNTIAQNNAGAGVALGFWSTSTIPSAQSNFYGLILEGEYPANTGRISIWVNGTRRDAYTITGFDKTASYTLSYTVDTSTGSITSVSLNGSAITLSWGSLTNSNIFTDANTNYAGVFGRSNSSVDQFGYIDNFSIAGDFTVIPEPRTLALLAGFICMSGVLVRRKRR